MIKYLGSKRTLLPDIVRLAGALPGVEAPGVKAPGVKAPGVKVPGVKVPGVRSVLDLFSGTSRVGHALKRAGYRVIANDHLTYAHKLATCYVQADRVDVLDDATALVEEFNRLPGRPGYVTEVFCRQSRFFQPKNGERIDAIRAAIAAKSLPPELEAVMLVSLMEAADRVDSTTGVQMAYVKRWAARSHNDLRLRVPDVLPRARHGKGAAHRLDAEQAVDTLGADLAYLDPPYNQHSYLGNYHVWETIARGDEPEHYGVACKRVDCKTRRSAFNSKRLAVEAFRSVIERVNATYLLVSFNNEGYIDRAAMERMLAVRGEVRVIERDYKRYVGAQIGIHNPAGERVGAVSHLRNKEFLYLVCPAGTDVALPTGEPAPLFAAAADAAGS